MATDKDKIIRPDDPDAPRISDVPRPNPRGGMQGMGRPGEPLTGAPSPNVTPTQPVEPSNRPPSGDMGAQGRSEARQQRGLQERAKQTAEGLTDKAQQRATDFYRRVDGVVREQVRQRPMGVVAGAFAAGYVLSAGMPRWVLRSALRIGLPLAAVGYLGRVLSEGRLDHLSDAEHRTHRHPDAGTPSTFR